MYWYIRVLVYWLFSLDLDLNLDLSFSLPAIRYTPGRIDTYTPFLNLDLNLDLDLNLNLDLSLSLPGELLLW